MRFPQRVASFIELTPVFAVQQRQRFTVVIEVVVMPVFGAVRDDGDLLQVEACVVQLHVPDVDHHWEELLLEARKEGLGHPRTSAGRRNSRRVQ